MESDEMAAQDNEILFPNKNFNGLSIHYKINIKNKTKNTVRREKKVPFVWLLHCPF